MDTTSNSNTENHTLDQPGSNNNSNTVVTENNVSRVSDSRNPDVQSSTNVLSNDSSTKDSNNKSFSNEVPSKSDSKAMSMETTPISSNQNSTSSDPKKTNLSKRKSTAKGKRTSKKMKIEEHGHDSQQDTLNSPSVENDNGHTKHGSKPYTGHRPVTSCTHCRQHKIKCNASEMFPGACSRCEKMGLHCEVDPDFRPKKGSQLQSLKNDIDELKLKLEYLTRNEGLIASALKKTQQGEKLIEEINQISFAHRVAQPIQGQLLSQSVTPTTSTAILNNNTNNTTEFSTNTPNSQLSQRVVTITENMPPVLRRALENDQHISTNSHEKLGNTNDRLQSGSGTTAMVTNAIPLLPLPHSSSDEFVIGDVHISIAKANELHSTFVERYLPAFPIMETKSAIELYSQSQILFWTVMLTACLSDPEPTMYNKLASLIKQLAIETCWIRTPRSTHISQALLILCSWPFPNEKVLDDCSYRFVGLAKSLSLQLGLHRGRFMSEFSRTQTSMPQAEKWRTRTWLGIFFQEQLWSSILGLPSTSHNDYLIEQALLPNENIFDLPFDFHCLIHLANFQAKLYRTMGSNINSPDGLIEGKERGKCLIILEQDLETLNNTVLKINVANSTTTSNGKKTNTNSDHCTSIEIYYLYVKLMICCFAFLPDTPKKDQKKHVFNAYKSSTRIITLVSQMLENGKQQLLELPIYVRQACTYAALMLFKLYLTPMLDNKYVDSARQSIVTVHRLYRNQLTAWATSVENDISRTASVLEKLNFVLITNPEVFIEEDGIISRMRSHLTGSLFYDLVWCIHEARRRELDPMYKKNQQLLNENKQLKKKSSKNTQRKLYPLPFYNQIAKEDFETITKTTPNGTTVTTLVPTANAIKNAKAQFTNTTNSSKNKKNKIYAINGIPLKMLDQTGSIKFLDSPLSTSLQRSASVQETPGSSYSAPSSIVVTPNNTTAQSVPSQQAHTNTFYSSAQMVGPQNNALMKNQNQNFDNNGSLVGPDISTSSSKNHLSVNQNSFGNPQSDVFTGSSTSLNINTIPISPVPPITSSFQASKSPQAYSQTPSGPGVSSTDLAGVYANNPAFVGQSNQNTLSRNSSLLSGMNLMGRPFLSNSSAPTSDVRNTGSTSLHPNMATSQYQIPNMPNNYVNRPADGMGNGTNIPETQVNIGNQSRSQSVPARPSSSSNNDNGAQSSTGIVPGGGSYQPPMSLFAYQNNQNPSGLPPQQIGTGPLRNTVQKFEAANDGSNSNTRTTTNSETSKSLDTTPTTNSRLYNDLDSFLQQQSAGWIEDNSTTDDVLGWFDINMAPEF